MSTNAFVAISAKGLLAMFNQAGVIDVADVHLAQTVGRLCHESDELVLLALALTGRALRHQAVCLPLATIADIDLTDPDTGQAQPVDVEWPDLDLWREHLVASPLVQVGGQATPSQRPLRMVDDALYLSRSWAEQDKVCRALLARLAVNPPPADEKTLNESLTRLFATQPATEQEHAVRTAVRSWTTVIAGGPGTGKTSTVARLLVTLSQQPDARSGLKIGLAAPSGKAAARLTDSLAEVNAAYPQLRLQPAGTLHRLLGARGLSRSYSYNADNPLPYDVVVVDETSMMSLTMMVDLLAALPDHCRLILLGDPNQLTSVDVGAVLADITAAELPAFLGSADTQVVTLRTGHRFAGAIGQLAEAIRTVDVDAALDLVSSHDVDGIDYCEMDSASVELEAPCRLRDDLLTQGRAIYRAALDGDSVAALAALDTHRLLCAHRFGAYGVTRWSQQIERLLRTQIEGYAMDGPWYLGRPLLVTSNQPDIALNNGDTAIIVATSDGPRAALGGTTPPRLLPPFMLGAVEDLYAMTVHKGQGSQFDQVTVVLPPPSSPLLTRELLYTAITRASHRVRIIGPIESLRRAIVTQAPRASGLTGRLRDGLAQVAHQSSDQLNITGQANQPPGHKPDH